MQTQAEVLAAGLDGLEERAAEAAAMLRLLAHEKRLLILCHLIAAREMSVTTLARTVGLSQSALSQHLARMRADGLVATRRNAQTIHYRIADSRVEEIVQALHRIFCPEVGNEKRRPVAAQPRRRAARSRPRQTLRS
jgi:DNA-binding transcriptional ArsR family regulator